LADCFSGFLLLAFGHHLTRVTYIRACPRPNRLVARRSLNGLPYSLLGGWFVSQNFLLQITNSATKNSIALAG
jgi:hypothetical protein